MNNFKKYPSYKDSEIEWLEEIPSHWDVIKVKHIFKERVEKGYPDKPLLAATQSGGVIKKEDYETNTVTAQKDFHLLKLVKQGDFVISLRSFQGGIEISHEEGIISPAYTIMKPSHSLNKNYFKHLLKSKYFIDGLTTFVTGIREGQNIDYSKFRRSHIISPPLPEQTAIANFLDKKTAEIKEFIALKEKTIELLKERKMAIINELVTGKIVWDGEAWTEPAEVKDSGIEWLGEIPKHWEKVRIGHYVNVFRGASPRPAGDPTLFGGDFMPWITVSEVTKKGEKYLYETETYLTQFGAKQSRFVYPEMLLLSNSGASLGVPKISLIKGCFNDGSVAFDKYNAKLQRDFLYHFFNSHTEIYRREMAGYGQPNLNTDIIKSTKIPLPPIDEQHAICKYIDSKTEEFNEIIKQTDKEIELIKEYQQSLISEVVTGKVDVTSFSDKE